MQFAAVVTCAYWLAAVKVITVCGLKDGKKRDVRHTSAATLHRLCL
jgi:hypothetical protein